MKLSWFTFVFLLIGHQLYCQEKYTIWVTSKSDNLATNRPKEFDHYSLIKLSKAFPSSKMANLKKVYELEFSTNAQALIDSINSGVYADLYYAVQAPELVPLFEPNDYSLVNGSNYALGLINATSAWELTHGDSLIRIGILDTNYDLSHEELQTKIAFIDPTNTNSQTVHGTAVAITAAGGTNNNVGISSIGFNSKVELRSMNYNQILEASYSGAKVINLSWASGCAYNQYCQDIIDEAYFNGSIIVAAAGNGSTCGGATNYVYPASFNHVFSVSSIGPLNNHERTIGIPSTTHQHNDSVDLCAPGYDVLLSTANGVYLTGNGTSFAAPFVSGTIALMLAVNPCLNFEQIDEIFKLSSFDLDTINPSYSGLLGHGRLDAGLAVSLAANYSTIPFNYHESFSCSDSSYTVLIDNVGASNYDVVWEDGTIGNTITAVPEGSILLGEIISTEGCFSTFELSLDSIAPLEIITEKTDVTCFGQNSASISAELNSSDIAYGWSNGETGLHLNNLYAGNYTLTVYRYEDCIDDFEFTITQPQEILIDIALEQTSLAGPITLHSIINGGVPDYTYSWNTGETDSLLQGVLGGFYELEVTDFKGCTASKNIYVPAHTFNVLNSPNANNYALIENTVVNNELYYYDQRLYFSSLDIEAYSLYNSIGQKVRINVEKNDNFFDLSGLVSGNYFVFIFLKNGKQISMPILVYE
jgi:hypothetical protein